jgi:hypothetical protein
MKFSSPSTALLVDGYDLTPALAETITRSDEVLTEQANPFGSTAEGHTPLNLTKGMIAVGGGIFDEAVDLLHAGLADSGLSDTVAATPRVVCVFNEGHTIGNHFTGYEGAYSQKYEVLDTNGKLVKANVGYQVIGQVDEGVIVQALAAQTVTWDTKSTPVDAADDSTAEQIPITGASVEADATSIITCPDEHHLASGDVIAIFGMAGGITPDINDSGAGAWQFVGHTVTVINSTSFSIPVDVTNDGTGGYFVRVSAATGGYAYQQVTARSGITANVGKIVHSVDASTWADLVTFTDTASGAHVPERKATATATTQVRRYLAHVSTLTTAGSTTVFSGFKRGL